MSPKATLYNWVRLMYALRAYINKFIFGKILSGIEKDVKTFSILDKIFSKNGILLCALKAHISKFLYTFTSLF